VGNNEVLRVSRRCWCSNEVRVTSSGVMRVVMVTRGCWYGMVVYHLFVFFPIFVGFYACRCIGPETWGSLGCTSGSVEGARFFLTAFVGQDKAWRYG
jgi:hypothetical protein